MFALVWTIPGTIKSSFKTRRELALENLVLRHQVGVLTRTAGDSASSPRLVGPLPVGGSLPSLEGVARRPGDRPTRGTGRVSRYMVRSRKPSSPTWRAFLENHVKDLVALDFCKSRHDSVQGLRPN